MLLPVLCPVLPVGETLQLFMAFDRHAGRAPGLSLAQHSPDFSEPPASVLLLSDINSGSNTSSSLTLTQRACPHISRMQFLSSLIPELPALKSKETTRLRNSLGQAQHTLQCRCCLALPALWGMPPSWLICRLLLSTRMLLLAHLGQSRR